MLPKMTDSWSSDWISAIAMSSSGERQPVRERSRVGEIVQRQHELLHSGSALGRDRARGVAAEFFDDRRRGERALAVAAIDLLAMAQRAACARRHDHLAAIMPRESRMRIDLVIDALAERENGRIPERFVLELGEREPSPDERRRDDVGNRELGVIAVGGTALVGERLAYGLDHFDRHQGADAVDLGRIEPLLAQERERRGDAGVNEKGGP